MISFKKLKWSNVFSYGTDNELDLDKFPLLQLIGKNGHGKTSVPLILEEVLFNKNSKNIKRADVLNRYTKDKSYSISLTFIKDNDTYSIETKRGSTQTVKLTRNGEDISSHTATATYKEIESILGLDHKTFSQIVFQPGSASLEFLVATDTNRKKFLIDLLNLTRYTELGETFKALVKQLDTELVAVSAKVSSTIQWLNSNAKVDLSIKPILPVPEISSADKLKELGAKKASLTTIDITNKRIIQNNKYKELLDGIVLDTNIERGDYDTSSQQQISIVSGKTISDANAFKAKVANLSGVCPTCYQPINNQILAGLIEQQDALIKEAQTNKTVADAEILNATALRKEWEAFIATKNKYEEYHSLYDPTMAHDLLDKASIELDIKQLERDINDLNAKIEAIVHVNNLAMQHNAKVEVIKDQQEKFNAELATLSVKSADLTRRTSILSVLVKAFSTTGLVAYKIECLVKDLENLINDYLNTLYSGRFQLTFQISGNDKLNVVINDNGNEVDILALSSGERARVNTATLLGIRKLLQSLSKNRVNLLILDETIENLDAEGKEKLVEVLLQEEYLNTVIVSHSFTHPLIEKLHIVKTNNISRIENV